MDRLFVISNSNLILIINDNSHYGLFNIVGSKGPDGGIGNQGNKGPNGDKGLNGEKGNLIQNKMTQYEYLKPYVMQPTIYELFTM